MKPEYGEILDEAVSSPRIGQHPNEPHDHRGKQNN
jgi:hypothetical protein